MRDRMLRVGPLAALDGSDPGRHRSGAFASSIHHGKNLPARGNGHHCPIVAGLFTLHSDEIAWPSLSANVNTIREPTLSGAFGCSSIT
jgi:hypothetical protein